MFNHLEGRAGHYGLLVLIAAGLFLTNLGGATLWDLDEGRNATAALEMRESGNWIVPTFNAQLRVDKPALLYWLQLLAYECCGINEFAARLPSALAALFTVLVCYELGRRLFASSTGLLAGLIVASTPMLAGAARFANPDALLNLCTALTFLFFWAGYVQGRLWFTWTGLAMGLAVLAKGPVGLALPTLTMLVFLYWNGRLHMLWHWKRMGQGILVFGLVTLPWYLWVAAETKGDFFRGFFLQHNVNRFLSPMESHTGAPGYYLAVLLIGLAPWSIFLGLAAWCAWWSLWRRPGPRWYSWWQGATDEEGSLVAYRLLGCWITLYLVFYALAATKLPNYILPVVSPCGLLIGRFLDRWRLGALQAPGWIMHLCLVILVLVGVGTAAGMIVASGVWPLPWLRGRIFPGMEVWAGAGAVPVLGAVLAWLLGRQRRTVWVASITLAAILFIGPLAAWASAAFNRFKAPRPLIEIAGALQRRQDIAIGCWQLEHLPSVNFYCQRDVTHFDKDEEILAFLRYPIQVFLFLPAAEWERLRPQVPGNVRELGRHHDFYRGHTVAVVSNR